MNRSRALIISWFRYHPRYDQFKGYRVMWEHWLKTFPLWAKEIDAFYLIDQGMNFTEEDERQLKEILPNTKILKSEVDGHHWNQFKWVIPQIQEEYMLFLDNDVVISKPGVVDGWFKDLELTNGDFLGSFDGSGGLQDVIRQQYPVMRQLGNRMGSYYFILTKRLLDKIGYYTFEPNYFEVGKVIPELDNYVTRYGDWLDSFGWFTLKMLHKGAKMLSIPDPRDTIYLQLEEDGWMISKEPENPENLGYYHIRNGNLANYIMTSWAAGNRTDFQREISSVKREYLRSLAWFCYMDHICGHKFEREINHVLSSGGVPEEKWTEYMKEFKQYHQLN